MHARAPHLVDPVLVHLLPSTSGGPSSTPIERRKGSSPTHEEWKDRPWYDKAIDNVVAFFEPQL